MFRIVLSFWRTYRRKLGVFALAVFTIWYADCLPAQFFSDPRSTVLLDREGRLLNATIANDGQWRFSPSNEVPAKLAICLIEFEDREFLSHCGVNFQSIGRAMFQNATNGRVVSGASTISMQVIRLMEKNPPRTYVQKLYEVLLATRMELSYSKNEILAMYASNAPFGGNVVGADAAAWRYFNRPASKLSWSESATLAVLPNAPGLIHPGRNREALTRKRNKLLKRLLDRGMLDKTQYELALAEKIPDRPKPLPQKASHLLQKFIAKGKKGQTIHATLDLNLQTRITKELASHQQFLAQNHIENGAVIVASVKTGEILSYVGNVPNTNGQNESFVNCASAPRSSGSVLKPILYAKSLEAGIITPKMLLPDVPSKFGDFSPVNYAATYDGFVHADDALKQSLNIPFVHLLNRYGLGKFHRNVLQYELSTINRSSRHYGLSLILGGAEVSLENLVNAYTRMAQEVEFNESSGIYFDKQTERSVKPSRTNPSALYEMFEVMTDLKRPGSDRNWEFFDSSRKIAWKTGTSFGFRDAWSIAVTPEYVVAVWVGNADGEGRPGLTGFQAAAPLLFRVIDQLSFSKEWFNVPHDHQSRISMCSESGQRANDLCPNKYQSVVPSTCLEKEACPYHQQIHVDAVGEYRVSDRCMDVFQMRHPVWFILPPLNAHYYKMHHPKYRELPPWKEDCGKNNSTPGFNIRYPSKSARISLARDLNGEEGELLLEASCSDQNTVLFWHLDDHFLGTTTKFHQFNCAPEKGNHTLTIVNEFGVTQSVNFEVI